MRISHYGEWRNLSAECSQEALRRSRGSVEQFDLPRSQVNEF